MSAFNPGIMAAWGHAGGGPGWGWNMMGGWGGWMGGPFMILIWVLVILAVVYGVRGLMRASRDDRPAPPRRSALEVLEERYARGELEREQYLAMRRDLGR